MTIRWLWWWSRYLEDVALDRLHHHRLHGHRFSAKVIVNLRLKHDTYKMTMHCEMDNGTYGWG